MNYQRIYDQIIDRARKENRQKAKGGTYYERHHIIPRCLGGSNSIENLILLTAREHFICHQLLCKVYPESIKLVFALWAMCNQKNDTQNSRHTPGSRVYEEVRIKFSLIQSNSKKGSVGYWKDRQKSEVHQNKITEALTGRTRSKETVLKNVESHLKYFNIGRYSKTGELLQIYEHTGKIEEYYDRDYVTMCLRGKQKSHKGFYWKLIN